MVLATVSGHDRAQRLAALGLSHAIDHRKADVAEEVMRLTSGRGVHLVVDPVGSTLRNSLASLQPEGRLVFVGNAGRAALDLDLWPALQANQSLMGVFMGTQFEKPEVYRAVAQLLERAARRELKVMIDRTFALADAALAHAYAEGSPILALLGQFRLRTH
ncbi:zinc-binding dehydrogenase [Pseudoroseomonas wenyumeiae]